MCPYTFGTYFSSQLVKLFHFTTNHKLQSFSGFLSQLVRRMYFQKILSIFYFDPPRVDFFMFYPTHKKMNRIIFDLTNHKESWYCPNSRGESIFKTILFIFDIIYDIIDDIIDKPCWEECGNKGGACPKVCGENGYCCRKGLANCTNVPATMLSESTHSCIKWSGDEKNNSKE